MTGLFIIEKKEAVQEVQSVFFSKLIIMIFDV